MLKEHLKLLSLSLFIVLFITFLGVFPFQVFASASDVSVTMVPTNPAPNQDVSISLSSYAANLDIVLIVWSVDGKKITSGIGQKSFSVRAGTSGSTNLVTASISLPDGAVETSVTIRPSEMALLWQADDSYVPPFYKGKAMPSPGSEIKVVAMPEIRTKAGLIDPKTMTYSWQLDNNNTPDSSGYGKNAFIYINDYLESSNNIAVNASTIDQKYNSAVDIDIGSTDPKIIFYKSDDSLGTIWNQAISDSHKVINNETLFAAPYFVSPKNIKNPMLVWSWFINNEMIYTPTINKNLIPLKVDSGVSGTSKIKLQIDNKYKIFETATKEITVEF